MLDVVTGLTEKADGNADCFSEKLEELCENRVADVTDDSDGKFDDEVDVKR